MLYRRCRSCHPPHPYGQPRRATALRLTLVLAASMACNGERSPRAAGTPTDSAISPVPGDSARTTSEPTPRVGEPVSSEGAQVDSTTGAAGAVTVLREYYAAIAAHRFREAYTLWGGNGAPSKQTFDEFARGYSDTRSVSVIPGAPGRVEGAAGSLYIEIPVAIDALATNGKHRRFAGSYVLRRAVVPGATPAERRWHIYSAQLHSVE